MTCRPVYNDNNWLDRWDVVKNPHNFPIEAFEKLNGIWSDSLSRWGVSWVNVDGIDHRDGTRTIKASKEDWGKVL